MRCACGRGAARASGGARTGEPDLRARYTVVGDGIPKPLTDDKPNVENGRRIVTERQAGLCVLCHSGPFPEVRFQGDIATNLAGTGSRWSEAQLRLRLVDASRLNPQTIMPSYYRTHGLRARGLAVAWPARAQRTADRRRGGVPAHAAGFAMIDRGRPDLSRRHVAGSGPRRRPGRRVASGARAVRRARRRAARFTGGAPTREGKRASSTSRRWWKTATRCRSPSPSTTR